MSFLRGYYYSKRSKALRLVYFPRDREGERERSEVKEPIEYDLKLNESLSRTRRTVRDYIFCNHFDYFCTFTFNQEKIDRFNYADCRKKLTRVFNNYKNRYSPGFRYVMVPEFHRNGAVHFHGVVSGIREEDLTVPDYIFKRDRKSGELLLVPNTKKYVDWKYYSEKLGFFSCSAIRNSTACGVYMSKYITKDLQQLPKGVQAVLNSKGLDKPELVFDMDDVAMPCDPDYKGEFCSIADTQDQWGFLPEWYGECCSDLADPVEVSDSELETLAFSPRLTGRQLSLVVE